MNYMLTLCYDGTRYRGWQRLPDDPRSIQGRIEAVLSRMEGKTVKISGCSRTDAGVHALGQTATVQLSGDRSPRRAGPHGGPGPHGAPLQRRIPR